MQAATHIPWLPFIIGLGFGIRLLIAPIMISQMVLINKMSQASPYFRIIGKMFKHVDMRITKKM